MLHQYLGTKMGPGLLLPWSPVPKSHLFPNPYLNMAQSKRFCFTWNNPESDHGAFLESFATVHCQYLVYGKEVGDSGTPHYQGFFTLKTKKRIPALRKLGVCCHLEPTKGTSLQASDYCKKDGDYVEFGIPPIPGQRTDLTAATNLISSGASMQEVASQCPETFVKFGRGLRDLALTLTKPYNHPQTRGLWIHGPPGTGKSHSARNLDNSAYLKPQSKWWDGYANEKTVILDDLDTNVLGHYLKIWSDKYACTGETKGGTVNLQHHMFIITSNYHPDDLWKEDHQMLEAVKRRFRIIEKTSKDQLIDHMKVDIK